MLSIELKWNGIEFFLLNCMLADLWAAPLWLGKDCSLFLSLQKLHTFCQGLWSCFSLLFPLDIHHPPPIQSCKLHQWEETQMGQSKQHVCASCTFINLPFSSSSSSSSISSGFTVSSVTLPSSENWNSKDSKQQTDGGSGPKWEHKYTC